jgi:hypothetical protein
VSTTATNAGSDAVVSSSRNTTTFTESPITIARPGSVPNSTCFIGVDFAILNHVT